MSNAVGEWARPNPNNPRRSAFGLREWVLLCRKMCKWAGAFQFSASSRIGTKANQAVLVLSR